MLATKFLIPSDCLAKDTGRNFSMHLIKYISRITNFLIKASKAKPDKTIPVIHISIIIRILL